MFLCTKVGPISRFTFGYAWAGRGAGSGAGAGVGLARPERVSGGGHVPATARPRRRGGARSRTGRPTASQTPGCTRPRRPCHRAERRTQGDSATPAWAWPERAVAYTCSGTVATGSLIFNGGMRQSRLKVSTGRLLRRVGLKRRAGRSEGRQFQRTIAWVIHAIQLPANLVNTLPYRERVLAVRPRRQVNTRNLQEAGRQELLESLRRRDSVRMLVHVAHVRHGGALEAAKGLHVPWVLVPCPWGLGLTVGVRPHQEQHVPWVQRRLRVVAGEHLGELPIEVGDALDSAKAQQRTPVASTSSNLHDGQAELFQRVDGLLVRDSAGVRVLQRRLVVHHKLLVELLRHKERRHVLVAERSQVDRLLIQAPRAADLAAVRVCERRHARPALHDDARDECQQREVSLQQRVARHVIPSLSRKLGKSTDEQLSPARLGEDRGRVHLRSDLVPRHVERAPVRHACSLARVGADLTGGYDHVVVELEVRFNLLVLTKARLCLLPLRLCRLAQERTHRRVVAIYNKVDSLEALAARLVRGKNARGRARASCDETLGHTKLVATLLPQLLRAVHERRHADVVRRVHSGFMLQQQDDDVLALRRPLVIEDHQSRVERSEASRVYRARARPGREEKRAQVGAATVCRRHQSRAPIALAHVSRRPVFQDALEQPHTHAARAAPLALARDLSRQGDRTPSFLVIRLRRNAFQQLVHRFEPVIAVLGRVEHRLLIGRARNILEAEALAKAARIATTTLRIEAKVGQRAPRGDWVAEDEGRLKESCGRLGGELGRSEQLVRESQRLGQRLQSA
eukprot:scaffold42212_cov64-Phaeocystis_antarctica.AAC.4